MNVSEKLQKVKNLEKELEELKKDSELTGVISIMDKIKTEADIWDYPIEDPKKFRDSAMAFYHAIERLSRVLNEDQPRSKEDPYYFPLFHNDGTGWTCIGHDIMMAKYSIGIPSYRTGELAVYAGTQFIELYSHVLI